MKKICGCDFRSLSRLVERLVSDSCPPASLCRPPTNDPSLLIIRQVNMDIWTHLQVPWAHFSEQNFERSSVVFSIISSSWRISVAKGNDVEIGKRDAIKVKR